MPKTASIPPRRLAGSIVCVIAAAWAGSAQAKLYKLGDETPVASVDIPADWEPSEIEDGVEATSPDKESYVAAEIIDGDDIDVAAKAEGKFFRKQKVKLKEDTLKKENVTLGALSGTDYRWDATDEDGPTHVSMTMLKISDKKLMMLTYWGSPAGEKSNGAALDAIAKSLKPIK